MNLLAEHSVADIAVIGAGVVGSAIARELSRSSLRIALIEAREDVGAGTSKANTALWHTGFDAKPGSLEARLVRRGHELLASEGPDLGIPLERTGAMVVAWTDEERDRFESIVSDAELNGYNQARIIEAQQLYQAEPHLGPGALGAVEIPDEGLLCPFTMPLAFATQAVKNGARLLLGTEVHAVTQRDDYHQLHLGGAGRLLTRYVVNAGGLHSDEIDRLFGHAEFTVRPRRGQLLVFDKFSRRLLNHIILPVPTARTKGVLVAPTVFGNVLVGPTAEDLDDKTSTETTPDGLRNLMAQAHRLVPALAMEEVTAAYAGLRAATEHPDYVIGFEREQRYVRVGGIRSTGLSSALAIAEHVADGLHELGVPLGNDRALEGVHMPYIGQTHSRPYERPTDIAADADYGRIVCFCERVSLGEVQAAFQSVIPPRDLQGLERRTRAGLGRCQGFYCGTRLARLTDELASRREDDRDAYPPT